MKTNRLTALAAIAFGLAAYAASAQTQQPYAGLQTRPIKALSDQQVADLRAGRGMWLALVAELNGYPGPSHVIELAEPLELSQSQRGKIEELFSAMKSETVPLGEKLLAQESDLDRQFAAKTITEASLATIAQAIGTSQAALRTAHLKYHLATLELLTQTQVQRYVELRGYSTGVQPLHQPGSHKH
jgi:hypothetical protein